jgi:hypothetical protein
MESLCSQLAACWHRSKWSSIVLLLFISCRQTVILRLLTELCSVLLLPPSPFILNNSEELQWVYVFDLCFHTTLIWEESRFFILNWLTIHPSIHPSTPPPIHLSFHPSIKSSTALLDLDSFFSFLINTQSVGRLGRWIRPSQGRYLHTGQHRQRINADRYPCLEWVSNPQSQCSSKRRQFMP